MMSKPNNFWRGKKVIVTGHEGFLGSWLTRALLACGARVVGVDIVRHRPFSVLEDLRDKLVGIKGDISDLKFVKAVISKYRPQVIFNLAAEAIVSEANKNPVRAFKANIEGAWNVLEASRGKRFIEAIVFASSDKAYGSHRALPYKEGIALRGSHPYDVSKSCADLLCYTYYNTYKTPVCVTRCGNIYGPGDFHFSRIVPDAIRSALKNKTLIIRSDGKFTRDYIYVEDAVSGYMLIAEKLRDSKLAGEAFNLSCEKPISVLELVRAIYKIAGAKPDYKILDKAQYEIKHQYLCSQKAKKILGWRPGYNLDNGLKKAVEWYKKSLNEKT